MSMKKALGSPVMNKSGVGGTTALLQPVLDIHGGNFFGFHFTGIKVLVVLATIR